MNTTTGRLYCGSEYYSVGEIIELVLSNIDNNASSIAIIMEFYYAVIIKKLN